MIDDPAVRSVRVAVALCDRFEELLRGPNVVSAHKANRALLGVSGNDDALSLRLGEAQQIYPEIWGHLDEARNAFSARGIDVASFDLIRENERQFLGTGAHVQMSYSAVGGPYGYGETVKRATFNQGGLQRSRSAIQCLMNATPDIDWAAIAKAEAADPHAAAFRRATLMKRIWLFAGLIAVLGIPFWYVMWSRHEENVKRDKWRREAEQRSYVQPMPKRSPPADLLPAQEQVELAARAKQTADRLDAALAAWSTQTAPDVLAALKFSAPCSPAITPPPQDVAEAYIKDGTENPAFAASDFTGFLAKDGAVPRDVIEARALNAKAALQTFEAKQAVKGSQGALEGLDAPFVFVVIARDDEPEVTAIDPKVVFKPGHVVARGYVYSVLDGAVVCAGDIDVKSSAPAAAADYLEGIDSESDAGRVLHRELEVRIRAALGTNLRGRPRGAPTL